MELIGTAEFDTGGYYNITVAGNYLYVADQDNGLLIFDVSNPQVPTLVGSFAPAEGTNQNTGQPSYGPVYQVDIAGNYAYVGDLGDIGPTGPLTDFQILDISNPEAPTVVGSYADLDEVFGEAAVGDYVYLDMISGNLRVLDVANPNVPTLASSYQTNGVLGGIAVSGSIGVFVDEYYGVIYTFGNSDPSSPAVLSSYQIPPNSPFSGIAVAAAISGQYLYVPESYLDFGSYGELAVLNISNPSSPALVGSFGGEGSLLDGMALGAIVVSGHYAYVAADDSGGDGILLRFDITDPTAPNLAGALTFGSSISQSPSALSLSNNELYVSLSDGVAVVDINPTLASDPFIPLAITPSNPTWQNVVIAAEQYVGSLWNWDNCTGLVWAVSVAVGAPFGETISEATNGQTTNATELSTVPDPLSGFVVPPTSSEADASSDWITFETPAWQSVVQPGDLVRIPSGVLNTDTAGHSFIVVSKNSQGQWVVIDNTDPDHIKGNLAPILISPHTFNAGTEFENQVLGAGTAYVSVLDPTLAPLVVSSGQTADIFETTDVAIDVLSGGVVEVASGGTAAGAFIGGGMLRLDAGGSLSGAIDFFGSGTLVIGGNSMPTNVISGFSLGDTIDLAGVAFESGAAAMTSGNTLQIIEDDSIFDLQFDISTQIVSFILVPDGQGFTDVVIGHPTNVPQNQTVNDQTVASGYVQTVYGVASGTAVNGGGIEYVNSGGDAAATVLASGGVQNVLFGGAVTDTTFSGGVQNVLSGASVSGTFIGSAGGSQNVFSGGLASGATLDGVASQNVMSGATAIDTTTSAGDEETVYAGGIDVGAQVSGGEQDVFGSASGATVFSGSQVVEAGGVAEGTTINSGGVQYAFGTVNGTVIGSGGVLIVEAGGTAGANNIGAVIISGGVTNEISGASNQSVTFTGSSGTLVLDDAASFNGSITGLTGQDALDLLDISFGTLIGQPIYSGNAASGTLSVNDGTYTANITLLGNYMASTFVATNDGRGGTYVVDPAPVAPTDATNVAQHSA